MYTVTYSLLLRIHIKIITYVICKTQKGVQNLTPLYCDSYISQGHSKWSSWSGLAGPQGKNKILVYKKQDKSARVIFGLKLIIL